MHERNRRSRFGGRDTTGRSRRRDGDTMRLQSIHDAPIGRPRAPRRYRAFVRRRVSTAVAARDLRSPGTRSGGDVRRRYKFLEMQPDEQVAYEFAPAVGFVPCRGRTEARTVSLAARRFPIPIPVPSDSSSWKTPFLANFFFLLRVRKYIEVERCISAYRSGISRSNCEERENILRCSPCRLIPRVIFYTYFRSVYIYIYIRHGTRELYVP